MSSDDPRPDAAPAPRRSGAGAPRSRRDRPAKPALSQEAIVDAGLAILREEGVGALSMRRVAAALDTGPASLYVYVANRDALHALLFDAALASVEVEATEPARWREQMHGLAVRMVRVMVEDFPGIAIMGMAAIPTGTHALRITESMVSLLRAGGMPDAALAYAPDLVSMYVTAIAYELALYQELYVDPEHEQHEVERVMESFKAITPDRYPTLASIAPLMTRGSGEERFALGLDIIINGLLHTPTDGRLSEGNWGDAPYAPPASPG